MKTKSLIFAGGAIVVLLLVIATISSISNAINKRNLNDEKFQMESLITQKNQVSGELDKVKSDLATVTAKNLTTEQNLSDAKSKLDQKARSIVFLNKSLIQSKNEIDQLKQSNTGLNKSYEELKLKDESAQSRIKDMERSAIAMDAEKIILTSKLNDAEKYRSDNMEIFGSKDNRKDKTTYLARNAKKFNISFEIPQSLTEEMTCKIVTPSGKIISPDNKSLTWLVKPDSNKITASLSSFSGESDKAKMVMVTYKSNVKLAPGIYEIQMYSSNGKNIGNCRIKLM
jgi:hypothetical protein